MILLDTHAWLWWVQDPDRLSAPARRAIVAEPMLGICAISCWEVAMLATKGRIQLNRSAQEWVERVLAAPGIELIPLSASAAVLAGSDRLPLHGDPADRMIAATAIERNLPIVTKDDRLRTVTDLTTIW